ncbi:collectin-11 [Plakobranchus ocellatus]|uniref:Collectin-11 n=1 Tax=Plakobranchus ocellatus TaxID=259542 RepID=A0AAV4BCL4_9GAST|nr:collectin-11 [Plakobranchus ocellatus]
MRYSVSQARLIPHLMWGEPFQSLLQSTPDHSLPDLHPMNMFLSPILLVLGVLAITSVQSYVRYNEAGYSYTLYAVSKDRERFDLAKMNNRCKERGGYLAQIDDHEEYTFLARYVHYLGGWGPFFTGITDEGSEGRFYYYNDKKPAKYLKWRRGQPDNWWNEDCVEIWRSGLNDRKCRRRGRYICEIPNTHGFPR